MSIECCVGVSHLFSQRDRIEQEIAKSLLFLGDKTKLRDACEYALRSGGKRFRPLIVLMVADALGHGLEVSEAALAVEFFHTASLIVDDLPCMDNEEQRRDRPSLHKIFGETVALLASYALITAAFGKIERNVSYLRTGPVPFSFSADRVGMLALENAAHCAGILGATGGQFIDLFPPSISLDVLRQAIYKKTVTLFEVSFVFGWLFGGGAIDQLDTVKRAAYHFGMAFQVADDIADLFEDNKRVKEINIARFLGKERAEALFEHELAQCKHLLSELGLHTPSFEKMCELLVALVSRYIATG